VRQAILQVHRWTGIVLGVYLITIAVTGSILVFRQELEPNPWHTAPAKEPFAGIAAVTQKLHAAYPRFRIVSITFPNQSDPTFVSILQGRGRIKIASSAAGGEVLGEFPARATWLDTVQALHETLLIPRRGRILNGVGAAFLLLMSVTGLTVWWPRGRNWKRAVTVDFRRRWRRINYDLHSATGFWTSLFLAFWAVTAIYFAWPQQMFQLVNRLSPVLNARPPVIRVTPVPDANSVRFSFYAAPPALDTLLTRASSLDPATKLSGIGFPYGPRAPLEIRMRRRGGTGREYEDTLYFNPYTGEYLAIWRYGVNRSLGDWTIWLQAPLHFGTSWGLGVKIVWAVTGLALPLLMITGVLMYWNRSLRRKWESLQRNRPRAGTALFTSAL
jgi:uncharacterized iron-regulated membrane protein